LDKNIFLIKKKLEKVKQQNNTPIQLIDQLKGGGEHLYINPVLILSLTVCASVSFIF
jgi:hypothetical protein